jgi:hypothetical protein
LKKFLFLVTAAILNGGQGCWTQFLIFSSETNGPISTKLWWNGPLPKLCLVIPTSNQDGRQAQNRKNGG